MKKLLREKYKTREGAAQRARFENAIASSEFERGFRAKLYQYTAVPASADDVERAGFVHWRVERVEVGQSRTGLTEVVP